MCSCCFCCYDDHFRLLFSRNKTTSRVSANSEQRVTSEGGDMSLHNGDDGGVQASSESFWEVGKFMRTVNRIDNGYKLCSQLKSLIQTRAEIERGYSKQLSQWSKKWNEFLDKGMNIINVS